MAKINQEKLMLFCNLTVFLIDLFHFILNSPYNSWEHKLSFGCFNELDLRAGEFMFAELIVEF